MKIFIYYNKESSNSTQIYNNIITNVKNLEISQEIETSDTIISIGGDGFLLNCIYNFSKYGKPVYPINGGHVGFLTNNFNIYTFEEDIVNADKIYLNPLQIKINNKNEYAFNEMSLLRKSTQAVHLELIINNKFVAKIIGDGLIISTPMGSSGYNYSSGGSILPLDSNLISITPICPCKPKNWRGAIVENSSKIEINVIDTTKRPVTLNLDNRDLGLIKEISLSSSTIIDNNIKVSLLFKNFDEYKLKILMEQFT